MDANESEKNKPEQKNKLIQLVYEVNYIIIHNIDCKFIFLAPRKW